MLRIEVPEGFSREQAALFQSGVLVAASACGVIGSASIAAASDFCDRQDDKEMPSSREGWSGAVSFEDSDLLTLESEALIRAAATSMVAQIDMQVTCLSDNDYRIVQMVYGPDLESVEFRKFPAMSSPPLQVAMHALNCNRLLLELTEHVLMFQHEISEGEVSGLRAFLEVSIHPTDHLKSSAC